MGNCPGCGAPLAPTNIPAVSRCAACGSHLVTVAGLAGVMGAAGVAMTVLPELAAQGKPSVPCPVCQRRMTDILLKGTTAAACVGCGATWLKAGALGRLTKGAYPDQAPPGAAHAPNAATGGAGVGWNAGAATSDASTSQRPGAPSGSPQLDNFLAETGWFRLEQRWEKIEALLGFETRNKYIIHTSAGTGHAEETDTGWAATLSRMFLRRMRATEVTISDAYGNPVLLLTRPFAWFPFLARTAHVQLADGRLLGTVHAPFSFIRATYEMLDARGRPFGTAVRGLPGVGWTFTIKDASEKETARITKQWSGLFKEAITNADNFEVTMVDAGRWTVPQKAVLLATALLIDFNHFETPNSGGGVLNLLDS